ncbi:MAG: succinylglutamate desuccinylase [Methanomassiliicoccales archaeon Mx-03]|nr:succinylglutamate desuccinylase [Methanomassiliicoccaceae archaeon DOK]TQS79959.1 MAG: succinylglutamate desuccinylase [Methanomassiliicoccales archaeon Mx-03]
MIENVVSIKLPVDEELRVQKNRIAPEGVGPDAKRICIVTGTHGDELEGQLVCFELARFLKANMQHLKGIVDIYPALNPLGIDSITRGIPGFDLDMNRTFPGRKDGSMPEYIASEIFNDIAGADVCIDIHASNIFLREIPQIRINELTAEELVPLARYMNVDFVWVHSAATVLESTLAYSLNMVGTKTLVAEMGVGMRLTIEYGNQLSKGIISLMAHLGMWDGPVPYVREPIVSVDGKVEYINAAKGGIFVPRIEHWRGVRQGEHLGDIVSPMTGEVLVKVESPCDGLVFTLREYPVVDEGSLIARILRE